MSETISKALVHTGVTLADRLRGEEEVTRLEGTDSGTVGGHGDERR